MGTWGAGLYSCDLALDLRDTIGALVRLPFDGRQILEVVSETVPEAADDASNEEHTVFWLVVADQFHRRGIDCAEVRRRALELIASGKDESVHRELGMSAASLRKRVKSTAELRTRLETLSLPPRPRPIQRPQALIMDAGEVYAFPTCKGQVWNPYVNPGNHPSYKWTQDAWGALLVIDRGLAFGFLAWYRIVLTQRELGEKPTLQSLGSVPWMSGGFGACSPTHFKRMQLERIGDLRIDRGALEATFGPLQHVSGAAVADSSIANYMNILSKHADGLGNFWPKSQHPAQLRRFAVAVTPSTVEG
jgi:hypothetical protein